MLLHLHPCMIRVHLFLSRPLRYRRDVIKRWQFSFSSIVIFCHQLMFFCDWLTIMSPGWRQVTVHCSAKRWTCVQFNIGAKQSVCHKSQWTHCNSLNRWCKKFWVGSIISNIFPRTKYALLLSLTCFYTCPCLCPWFVCSAQVFLVVI